MKVHVRKLEIEVADNLQYQRGNDIVLSGISTDVVDELLEPTVIDILKKIGRCSFSEGNRGCTQDFEGQKANNRTFR